VNVVMEWPPDETLRWFDAAVRLVKAKQGAK
jgi:hypothetical protein